jgi:hypothetical protein
MNTSKSKPYKKLEPEVYQQVIRKLPNSSILTIITIPTMGISQLVFIN